MSDRRRGKQIMGNVSNYLVLDLDELGVVTGGMPDEDHQNRFFELRPGHRNKGRKIENVNTEKEKYPA